MTSKKNPHWGTALDAFLAEDGIRETAKAGALTRVGAWQLSQEWHGRTSPRPLSPSTCKPSRAQVDRILKAQGNVTIESLQPAAALVGRKLRLGLV
jgi:antitoxin HicB